ncbi:MAG: glycosyltransferase family 2 protein [Opitutaceae bacterium]
MTARSLDRLIEKTKTEFDLVCVDGNSPPDVQKYLEQKAAEHSFTIIRADQYLAPNQARNLAIVWAQKHTPAEYIVFVDNDVLVNDNWLSTLIECADSTQAGIVGPTYFEHLPECSMIHMYGGECEIRTDEKGRKVYHEKHHYQHTPVDSLEAPLQRMQTRLIEFHVVLVRLSLFDKIGLLDEALLCHAEHGDLCMLAKEAGHEIWLEPESKVTYVPPKRLALGDHAYFFLRWSDAWTFSNQARLKAKWNLDYVANTNGRGVEWVRMHRRFGYHWLKRLKKWFGRKRSRFIMEKIIIPLEPKWNQLKYPLKTHTTPRAPNINIIEAGTLDDFKPAT